MAIRKLISARPSPARLRSTSSLRTPALRASARNLLLGLILGAGALSSSAGRAEAPTKVFLNGEPAPVYFNDGDSFRVLDGKFKDTRARLAGFNTLETFGPVHQWGTWTYKEMYVLSKMATANARDGVWHCESELERDGYGRILWHCQDLAVDQVRKGLAHALTVTMDPADPELLAAQREAIANKRGMWAHGVPALVLTSLHSIAEDGGGSDGKAYNRVVSTVDGHSEAWLHTERYGECQAVCMEVSPLSEADAKAAAEAFAGDAEVEARFAGLSLDEQRRLLEAFLAGAIDKKDTPVTTRIKKTLRGLVEQGVIKPGAKRKDACHIYVDFKRRYGGGRAACLR